MGNGYISDPVDIISSPQTLTETWTDCGDSINIREYDRILIWNDLTINDSLNFRIRLVTRLTEDGDDYSLPISINGTDNVRLNHEYIEYDLDIDQKLVYSWDIDNLSSWIQLQVQVGEAGTVPAVIEDIKYSLGN